MSDIEKAVTFLHDSIPTWFEGIAEIEERVARLQDEISRVPVARSPPIRRRTGSIESIREQDAVMDDSNATQQIPLATRKRKTASVLSERASGPVKYRSRQMVVVVYDGQIQKSFETLVRSIGTGRNMLRKGKMQAQLDAMAAIAGSDDDDDDDADDIAISKIRYRHRANFSSMRGRGPMRNMRTMRGVENNSNAIVAPEEFDFADKALELAQGLCEKAAHQSLRDGECRKELEGVKKHCQEVLEKAKNAVERLAAHKEKEEQEKATSQGSTKMDLSSLTTHEITMLPPRNGPKSTLPQVQPIPATSFTAQKPSEIEIDVDEGDDGSFIMPPIRMTSRV